MNIGSPNCVSGMFHYVDNCQSAEQDNHHDESVHHLLVERWFRERFFLPARPYRSTTMIYDDGEDCMENDIIDDGESMALFSDDLVSKEIRSNIDVVPLFLEDRPGKSNSTWRLERRKPPGVVMVVDQGAPLMPLSRVVGEDGNRMDAASSDDDATGCNASYSCKPSLGFINRTFSFDEQLPIVHRRRAAPIKALYKCMDEDDDDIYMDENQPTFTMPITYSKNDDSNRSKVVYPVPVPAVAP